MANEIREFDLGKQSRVGAKPAGGSPRRAPRKTADAAPPERANLNIIPAPESLEGLISRAISAFKKGVFWDRGTILNLLV